MATNNYRGIYAIKPWWQRRLASIEDILVARHVHPDIITLAGVGCAALMAVALAGSASRPWLTLAVAPLAVARLAANALDGLVARRTGRARPWGEVFNECCDRLADTLVFVGLACNPLVNAALAWATLVLILLNSYLGTVPKAAGGKRQFGGLLAKADRMIYMALFSFVPFLYCCATWNWLQLAFVPATLFTIVQRYRWAYTDLHQAECERSHQS
jgi:phosphatidylglycerophosphate synthase